MLPTEELKQDHRVIERMCIVLEKAASKIDRGQEIRPDFFPRAVEFIRIYADYAHHGKEEETLFPAMEKYGIPRDDGPVGVMLAEHDEGRGYVKGMDEAARQLAAGDKIAAKKAAQNARAYALLLQPHIQKEDNILYEMANQALSSADQRELSEKFARIESERMGREKRRQFVRLVDELEKEFAK